MGNYPFQTWVANSDFYTFRNPISFYHSHKNAQKTLQTKSWPSQNELNRITLLKPRLTSCSACPIIWLEGSRKKDTKWSSCSQVALDQWTIYFHVSAKNLNRVRTHQGFAAVLSLVTMHEHVLCESTWLQLLWWDRRQSCTQACCLIILYASSDISNFSAGPREGITSTDHKGANCYGRQSHIRDVAEDRN